MDYIQCIHIMHQHVMTWCHMFSHHLQVESSWQCAFWNAFANAVGMPKSPWPWILSIGESLKRRRKSLKIKLSMFPKRFCSNVKTRYQTKKSREVVSLYNKIKTLCSLILLLYITYKAGVLLTSAAGQAAWGTRLRIWTLRCWVAESDWWDATPVVEKKTQKKHKTFQHFGVMIDDWGFLMMIDDWWWNITSKLVYTGQWRFVRRHSPLGHRSEQLPGLCHEPLSFTGMQLEITGIIKVLKGVWCLRW